MQISNGMKSRLPLLSLQADFARRDAGNGSGAISDAILGAAFVRRRTCRRRTEPFHIAAKRGADPSRYHRSL